MAGPKWKVVGVEPEKWGYTKTGGNCGEQNFRLAVRLRAPAI
jgi:hypothetical protein